jgi:hypothetical protein
MRKYSGEYKALQPYVVEEIRRIVGRSGGGGGGDGGGGVAGSVAAHNLSDTTKHLGQLAATQAAWAATKVELVAHAADPDAHHARQHTLATTSGLGGDHTVSGTQAGQVLRANSATTAMMAFLSHGDLTGVTPDQHHARQHNVTSTADHAITGVKWNVLGATADNTLGLLLPLADVTSTPKEALLKSDASGYLALVRLTLSDRLRANLLDTVAGDMTLQPTADLILDPGGGELFIPGADTLRSSSWTAGLLGTGWGIQERAGQAGKSHLDIRSIYTDELIATTFTADQVRVRMASDWLGESLAIAARNNSDAKVTIPNVGGGAVRIYVENAPEVTGQIFDNNEFVLVKTINRSTGLVIRETWGQVSSYQAETGGRQSYSWTTVNGGGNFTLEPGTALVGFGVNGGSYIFRTVIEAGRGPYERFATWSSNPYTPANRVSRVEVGDIRNVAGDSTTRYGIGAGNNLAWTPANGFSGFTADSVYGFQLFNADLRFFNSAVRKMWITGQYGIWLTSHGSSVSDPPGNLIRWATDLSTDNPWTVAEIYSVDNNITREFQIKSNTGPDDTFATVMLQTRHSSAANLATLTLRSGPTDSSFGATVVGGISFAVGPAGGYSFGQNGGAGSYPSFKIGAWEAWHAGNLNPGAYALLSGAVFTGEVSATTIKNVNGGYYSDNTHTFYNLAGTALQTVTANGVACINLGLTGGVYADNPLGFRTNQGAGQRIWVDALLTSNAYSDHNARVPTNGIYSLGPVAIATTDGAGSGFNLDVSGAARVRGSVLAPLLRLSTTTAPTAVAGQAIMWFDGTNIKVTLSGSTKTLSWT